MDTNSIRVVSVLRSMTIVLSMFGWIQIKKFTLNGSRDAKRSVNVVTRVTTSTVTTNVSNFQKTVKRPIRMENALNAAKVTFSRVESVLLMIIVKNTDGSMLVRNGKRLTSKDVLKSVNVVKRVTISTVITNVNHYHAIVKKLTLTEAANAVKKVTNFAMENAFKRRKTEDIEIDKQSQIPSVAMKRIIAS